MLRMMHWETLTLDFVWFGVGAKTSSYTVAHNGLNLTILSPQPPPRLGWQAWATKPCLALAFLHIAECLKTSSISITQFAKNNSTQNLGPEIPIL